MLKGLLKISLIGCSSLILLLVLLVAGLMAWDYIDQKLAEKQASSPAPAPAPSEG
ncbi:MAG: hypothetical protein M1118_11425 [Chloroflexi bacterium]|nr:hypothetical protein [Chloroflexota bacterium]